MQKNLYLLYGEEKYLIKQYESKLKKSIVSEEMEMMNYDFFEGKGIDSQKLIDAAMTFPFMADHRLVVVKDSGFFTAAKKDDRLNDFFQNDLGTTVIIFIEEDIDKRGKLYKTVSKNGEVKEFKSPSEKELTDFTSELFKKSKVKISKNALSYLLLSVSGNMESLVLETDKLASYKGEGAEVTIEDIDLVCAKALEVRIFELVGAIGQKNPEKALEVYNNMILMKESPIMVLAMIIRQFRYILLTKYMNRRTSISNEEIAQTLGLRSFVVGEFLKQSKNFTESILLKALEECLETDLNIKTGKIEQILAVEILILKYS